MKNKVLVIRCPTWDHDPPLHVKYHARNSSVVEVEVGIQGEDLGCLEGHGLITSRIVLVKVFR